MTRLSEEKKLQVVQRARQIISDHPDWGRRRVNRLLRSELGAGLRDSTINKMSTTTRKAVAVNAPELPPTNRITLRTQRQTLLQAGFLPSEIVARRKLGKIRFAHSGLGMTLADAEHNQFRPVLERMIQERYLEYRDFQKKAERYGWGKAKRSAKWTAHILKNYRNGSFPIYSSPESRRGKMPSIHPTSDGGGFMTADGRISPWGLYHAFLAYLRAVDPFGGLGFDSPRPVGGGKPAPMRARTRRVIREHIKAEREQLNQTDASIARAGESRNWSAVKNLVGVHNAIMTRIDKLNEEMKRATR